MSTELTPSMRRSVLIAALRDEQLWPKGFRWNYDFCKTCAAGLAERIGLCVGEDEASINWAVPVTKALGLRPDQGARVFYSTHGVLRLSEVTPAMVADRLETIHRELESADSPHPARPWSS
jgi:hypothetical protein